MKNRLRYDHNKKNYLHLTGQHLTSMSGGGIGENEENKKLITAYNFTMESFYNFPDIRLADLILNVPEIQKIGSFDVKTKVVIGDTDYEKLKLKSGRYSAYTIAESLMIIH